jgi:hypothetical protein
MIELKHNGVSEKVIMAMLARQEGAEMSDDALTDDAFFNSGLDPKSSSNTNSPNSSPNSNPNDGSTDIFGNSSERNRALKRGAMETVDLTAIL